MKAGAAQRGIGSATDRGTDTTRARTLLGWKPAVSLDEGLDRTLDHFRRKLGLPES